MPASLACMNCNRFFRSGATARLHYDATGHTVMPAARVNAHPRRNLRPSTFTNVAKIRLAKVLTLSGLWVVSGSVDSRSGRLTLRNW